MSAVFAKEYQHIGASHGCSDRDHDLVHELSAKLDALWRYDQYIANAEGCPHVQGFWQELKRRCQSDIERIKELITEEMHKGCF